MSFKTFKKYVLDEEHHVVEADLMTWARFMENHKARVVEQTTTRFHWVSTVFIGIDHRWLGEGPPVVFETMTFDRERRVKNLLGRLRSVLEEADDVEYGFNRYCSWDDALTGHRAVVGRLRRAERKALALMEKERP